MVSPFYFFDGLMCGVNGIYRPDEDDNLILNLYGMGNAVDDASTFSLLVGVHAMSLLDKGNAWSKVTQTLLTIGYPQEDVASAASWLEAKGVVKWIGKNKKSAEEYQVETPLIKAHWTILRERAYTDNAAISMGPAMKLVESAEGAVTDSTNYADCSRRVRLSCSFLRCIKAAQDKIQNSGTAQARHAMTHDRFKDDFDNLALPDVYVYAGAAYRDRALRAIREATLKLYLRSRDEFDEVQTVLMELPSQYKAALHVLRASK